MNIKKRLFTRRNFFGSAVAAVGALGYMRFAEAEWLELNERAVQLNRLPAPQRKEFRILHLSDFHASPAVSLKFIEEAVDLACSTKPDLICLTGDFITAKFDHFPEYAQIMRKLGKAAPTFACVGNHDGGSWVRARGYADWSLVANMLEQAGITLLHNSARTISRNDRKLQLVGVGDLWAKELNAKKAFAEASKATPTILLSHNPDSKTELANHPWDLMLSGHTHGGQLKIPFLNVTPFAPVRDQRYVAGLKQWQDRWIHVTKGVGNLHGMRFNCRPEVSVVRISI